MVGGITAVVEVAETMVVAGGLVGATVAAELSPQAASSNATNKPTKGAVIAPLEERSTRILTDLLNAVTGPFFDRKFDSGAFLIINIHVNKGRDTDNVNPAADQVATRNGDSLDSLVGSTCADGLYFDPTSLSNYSGNRACHRTGARFS
jgi:cell division GTPase FtsZ